MLKCSKLLNLIDNILEHITSGEIKNYDDLEKYKMKLSKEFKVNLPKNSDIIALIPEEARERFYPFLKKKPTRTLSGVAIIAAMSSPSPCPHGKCIYCPGGVEFDTAQSYTGKEPAALRAIQNNYDPYRQTMMRMRQLENIGHSTSKIDVIVMGGTFTARTTAYQEYFVKGIYDALNGMQSESLEEAIQKNEIAEHRAIGLTVETRPDWFNISQIDESLKLGVTRVELGVQTVFDDVLKFVNRGHGQTEIIESTQLSKDAGLKVAYHMMPGLPGMDPDRDLASFKTVFENDAYKPDMLKIYPTLVIKNTGLYELWKNKEYEPYYNNDVVELMIRVMKIIPRWVRIQRIQRDIPVQLIEAGVTRSDIRALIQDTMRRRGEKCNCIRCREIGYKIRENEIKKDQMIELKEEQYTASGGIERFISIEDTNNDALIGYLRLRKPSTKAHRLELSDSAIVRELKVVGPEVPLNYDFSFGYQHQGYGKALMTRAEQVTADWGFKYLLVNSGVGARNYYRKLGYELYGPFMRKLLK
ncbi:MAG: tRNA uridine(34) 5-carboxymethylaminomethyl modification radical SAM/GNAT enzyme Elp3 [Thermoplasmata archaeon]